jgi:uncharacterized membrane protein
MVPQPPVGPILDPWDDDPTAPGRAPRPRPPRRPLRVTTRGLMLGVAVLAVELVVLAESHRIGPGVEFTLFMGAVLVTLDFLVPGLLAYVDRVNAVPAERQGAELFNLGCLLFLVSLLIIPVALVLMLRGGR